MTLFGGRQKRGFLENADIPLTSTNLISWFGGQTAAAGVQVSEQRVLGLPAYYRAIAIKAGTMAAQPVRVFRAKGRELVPQSTILDKPNPRQTPIEFWMTIFAAQTAWGNTFARKFRDGSGTVREAWPIHPVRVRFEDVDPTDANPEGKVFLILDRRGQEQRYTSFDIFHLPYLSVDGMCGVRPIEAFRQSLGIAIAGDDSAASLFANGSMPAGILKTAQTLEQPAADRLKARWKEKLGGPQNRGDIAILDSGAEFQAISIPPADAQLLESRNWSVSEIGRMVGIPPHLLGDTDKSTSWGSGIEMQTLAWVKFDLATLGGIRDQRTTWELLPGGRIGAWQAETDFDNLLRGDSAAQASFFHAGIVDGWLNRNEVRGFKNLPPVDGLDEFIVPSNMTLVNVDGSYVPLSGKGVADASSAQ